jgi:catechol 2,3-dioxygenase-like lactoylglutathione lyase family enzyme
VLLAAFSLYELPAMASQLPLLGLARVSIRVSDLEQARAFYTGVAGFEEAYDAKDAHGSVAAAYFKIDDDQFLEIIPGLKPDDVRPMVGFAIRTNKLEALRKMLAADGLKPGKIEVDADGSRGFKLTSLPGQNLDYVEFVQYGPKSLAERTKGKYLGANRLSDHLEHVGVATTDFDTACNFYVKTLGFHESYRRVVNDRSHAALDHIQMPGPSADTVELFYPSAGPLKRSRAASMAHFALTVPDEQAVVAAAHLREPGVHLGVPGYGMDNRWNFNLFDPDGTRVEFMQVVDPAHPTPALAVTPLNWHEPKGDVGAFEGQSDIGNPALAGSSSYDPVQQQYTVSGAGANMWAGKDEFHFVWRRISADFSLTATVRFPKQEPPSHRKAALMARENLDSGSAYADAVVHGSGLTELQFRDALAGATHAIRFPVDAPARIRLERKQGWFTMYAGAEGQPLQELGAYQLKLKDPIYLGLAVCSHNASTIETAVFSDVVFTEIPKTQQKSGKE